MQTLPPRPSLVAHIADHLREALQRGEWKDFLPGERSLSDWLQTSRPTLRAALAQLESEGWLSVMHGKRRRILGSKKTLPKLPPSRLIAILSPVPLQAMPPFVMVWVDVLRGLLGKAGFQLEVHAAPQCYSAHPAAQLKKLTQRVPSATWVLFRTTTMAQRWFSEAGSRAVVAGSCGEGIRLPSVDLDYRATCRHGAGLLLKKATGASRCCYRALLVEAIWKVSVDSSRPLEAVTNPRRCPQSFIAVRRPRGLWSVSMQPSGEIMRRRPFSWRAPCTP